MTAPANRQDGEHTPGCSLERLINIARDLADDDYSFPLVDEADVIEPACMELNTLLRERDELRKVAERVAEESCRGSGRPGPCSCLPCSARAALSQVKP